MPPREPWEPICSSRATRVVILSANARMILTLKRAWSLILPTRIGLECATKGIQQIMWVPRRNCTNDGPLTDVARFGSHTGTVQTIFHQKPLQMQRQGRAGHGRAGIAGQGRAWRGGAGQGRAGLQGRAGHGRAEQRGPGQGKAMQGRARQGRAGQPHHAFIPCHALSCPVLPCSAMLCPALPCRALPCPAMMPVLAVSCTAIPRLLYHAMPCPSLPCHA